jgi:Domain of unknown function (DUF4185)
MSSKRKSEILQSRGTGENQKKMPGSSRISFLMLAVVISALLVGSSRAPGQQNTPKSNVLTGFEWIGDQKAYVSSEDPSKLGNTKWFAKGPPIQRGDTFPMTWADDGEIYSSAGDPNWGGKNDGLDIEKFTGVPPNYTIKRVNPMSDYKGSGGDGTKPSGMISVNGVLYLAFQNLLGAKPPAQGPQAHGKQGVMGKVSQHGTDATIVSSHDHGLTWTPSIKDINTPMFPGNFFGGPAFVNNGRDNANAPDDYVYAVSTDQWDNGSNLRVGRVRADHIADQSTWEWITNITDVSHPVWSGNLQQAVPVLKDDLRISMPDMVYIASIKRYILMTWSLKKPFSPLDGTELTIYDAPHPWGPFTLVHHEDIWESVDMTPYCPRLPLKWLQVKDGELDGWIQFSGSYRHNSPHYRSHVRQFKMTVHNPS